jgi:hypothetical protein
VLVKLTAGNQQRALLENPYRFKVVAETPGGETWRSEEVLAIR